jgi:hypothetical protein
LVCFVALAKNITNAARVWVCVACEGVKKKEQLPRFY